MEPMTDNGATPNCDIQSHKLFSMWALASRQVVGVNKYVDLQFPHSWEQESVLSNPLQRTAVQLSQSCVNLPVPA